MSLCFQCLVFARVVHDAAGIDAAAATVTATTAASTITAFNHLSG